MRNMSAYPNYSLLSRVLLPKNRRGKMSQELLVFLAIRVGVKWHLLVVLVCISWMATDIWHICISALENRLFRAFVHLKIG